jgi:high-affinity iron transporter
MFEAAVGLIAVGILTSMVFWMKKAARSIKAHLHDSIEAALKPGDRQGIALTGMAFFAVAREGLESVFFLLATFQQNVGISAPIGAIAGLLVAVGVGVGIYYGGVRINLKRFFHWTGVFILFVAAGLLAGSVRALHEAGLWNGLQAVVFDLSNVLPSDSALGSVLGSILGYQDTPTVSEVLAYCLFLIPALFLFLGNMQTPAVAKRGA